jgi:cytochrome c551/c552
MKLMFLVLCLAISGHYSPAIADSMALARQKNCLACHAIDKKLLGPAYNDVATKYADQSGAVDTLTTKVMRGGSGVWGSAAMPANHVTAEEARQLVQWILSLKQNAPQEQSENGNQEKPTASPAANEQVPKAVTSALPKIHADEQTLKNGRYLVESVLACGNCHSGTAGTFGTPGQPLSGGRSYDTPEFRVTAGNLTSDVDTGLGDWTVDDLKRVLVQGVRPDGVPLAPAMPWGFFKALTSEDLDAVANYVISLPPVRNAIPASVYKKELKNEDYPDAQRPFAASEINSDQIVRGRYLAALGHCLECHTPEVNGNSDFVRDGGRGGRHLGPNKLLVPNITSDPVAGLGSWSDEEIKRALTVGISRDGRHLGFPMPWPYVAKLKPTDLDALVAWLRTLPPKQ